MLSLNDEYASTWLKLKWQIQQYTASLPTTYGRSWLGKEKKKKKRSENTTVECVYILHSIKPPLFLKINHPTKSAHDFYNQSTTRKWAK